MLASVDWGSVPDWLAGIGAILALIFAFFAVLAAHRTTVQQGLQLKVIQEDRARLQAGKVACWIHDDGGPVCRVQNGSDLPVFTTHVLIRYWPTVSPGMLDDVRWWHRISVWTCPPGCIDLPIRAENLPTPPRLTSGSAQAAIVFSDAHGVLWKRDINGRLSEIDVDIMRTIFDSSTADWTKADDAPTLDMHLRGRDRI
jgi:hypothetical protein